MYQIFFLGPENGFQEQELATKMLQIQSKRFYLDVKQVRQGADPIKLFSAKSFMLRWN